VKLQIRIKKELLLPLWDQKLFLSALFGALAAVGIEAKTVTKLSSVYL
jgi:hypothetical protein